MTAIEELAILFGSERPVGTEAERDRDRVIVRAWWRVKDLRLDAEATRDQHASDIFRDEAEVLAHRVLMWWRSTR